jgi:DNA polymerase III epsilon subunit-like protein
MDAARLPERKLSELAFVAFDTEATGYSNVTDRLVEIAGVRFRWGEAGWRTEGTFEELIDPGRPMPPETVAVHGLTDDRLAGAAPAVEVLDRFLAFAHDALLAVHYAPADMGMMAFAYVRAGRPAPAAFALDTSPLSRRLIPGARDYSLETLAAQLGLPAPTHRARPDALATQALFEHCAARPGEPAALTVGELVARAGPLVTLEEFIGLPLELPERLADVGRGLAEGRDVTLEYRGGSKGPVPRRVTPQYLFARQGHVFLEGFCHLDREKKSFRIDRIQRAVLIAGPPGA